MLVQLIYISIPEQGCSDSIAAAVQEIKGRMTDSGVNTVMLANDHFFLQLIEGPRDQVSQLFSTVANDPRHTNVNLVRFQEIRRPEFSGCNVLYLHNDESCQDHIAEACSISELTMEKVTGAVASSIIRRAVAVAKSGTCKLVH